MRGPVANTGARADSVRAICTPGERSNLARKAESRKSLSAEVMVADKGSPS
jgi:hypothetical protein